MKNTVEESYDRASDNRKKIDGRLKRPGIDLPYQIIAPKLTAFSDPDH
jgi:hypothetical protein